MIDDYRFGRMIIDGRTYASDVIIFPDRVQGSWWRKNGHSLCREDIEDVLRAKPEVLVVGTGAGGVMKIPPAVAERIRAEGIELIARETASACRTYNSLLGKRTVIGAFHLTC
ncbi:MAG: MTH938/NDUFAF3 family protein [PVC group bacterium]